jgi:anti-sigma regulatory factor (Ser/Thr protein kinase)
VGGVDLMLSEFKRSLPAAIDQIPGLLDAIEAWLEEANVASHDLARLMIVFDEILSNISKYGSGTIDLAITITSNLFRATIVDDGPEFDPLDRPLPNTDLDIDERSIGGLGIHLVREMMDEVSYTYQNGLNCLKFHKTL